MIESSIDFVYDYCERSEIDPHPREINKCYDEIYENMNSVMSIFPKNNLTQREIAILKSLGSLFDSITKYSDQVDSTVGYLEGFLESNIKWSDELLTENIKIKTLKNIFKKIKILKKEF